MYQKKFDKIIELLDQFNKPKIIKNERSELIKQMKSMEVVYKTLNDFS